MFGSIASSVVGLLTSQQAQEMIRRLGGQGGFTDAFLAAELGFIGVITSAYGIQAAMRLRSEEAALRAEPLLATPVGRARWATSHITVVLFGTTVLLAGAGLSAGAAHAARTGDPHQIGRVLGGALVQLPAVWVLTAIVVAAFGLAPRATVAGWAALTAFLLLGELGPLLRLDQWVMDLSPFTHIPRMPGAVLTATPLAWLFAVAAMLMAMGLAGFRHRDLETT